MITTITDLDGVWIDGNTSLSFAKFLENRGIMDGLTAKDLNDTLIAYKGGSASYQQMARAFEDAYMDTLTGLNGEKFREAREYFFEEDFDWPLFDYTEPLLGLLRNKGDVFGVTAGADELSERLKQRLDMEDVEGPTRMVLKNGIYQPVENPEDMVGFKERKSEEIKQKNPGPCAGAGDSEHDKALMDLKYPLVFNPNEAMREEAEKNGWPIVTDSDDVVGRVEEELSRE